MVQVTKAVHAHTQSAMTVQSVCVEVERQLGVKCYYRKVIPVIKHDLGLSYRRARILTTLTNSDKSVILRQKYCLKLLRVLEAGFLLINWDECLFVQG